MEEIIIDGVDVNKCKLYDYGICASEMASNLNCEDNKDCYYKQVKRLEKENEQLEQENEEYRQTIQKFMDNAGIECDDDEQELRTLQSAGTCLFKLRLENDDLKQTIKDLTQSLDDCNDDRTKLYKENEEWHIKYAGCNTANSAIQEENKNYRSALEEIRKIVKNVSSFTACDDKRLDKIQTIITEAIGE